MSLKLFVVAAGLLVTGTERAAIQPRPTGPEFAGAPTSLLGLSSARIFHPFGLVPAEPSSVTARPSILKLENRKTDVACALRILPAKPSLDPGIFSPASGPKPDSIVRNGASPCVE